MNTKYVLCIDDSQREGFDVVDTYIQRGTVYSVECRNKEVTTITGVHMLFASDRFIDLTDMQDKNDSC